MFSSTFQEETNRTQINETHEEDKHKKVPVTYDSVKNAVVGDSITKRTK